MDKSRIKGCGRLAKTYNDPHPSNPDTPVFCGNKDPFIPDKTIYCKECLNESKIRTDFPLTDEQIETLKGAIIAWVNCSDKTVSWDTVDEFIDWWKGTHEANEKQKVKPNEKRR